MGRQSRKDQIKSTGGTVVTAQLFKDSYRFLRALSMLLQEAQPGRHIVLRYHQSLIMCPEAPYPGPRPARGTAAEGGEKIDRLRLAGQSHALAAAAVVLAISLISRTELKAFGRGYRRSADALVVFLRKKSPRKVDPANPPAVMDRRKLRNSKKAVCRYRWARKLDFLRSLS